jgi:predicted deacylase
VSRIAARAAIALVAACAIAPAGAQFDPARASVESAAVAALFPDPRVDYPTPGFRGGRTDFTSHAELVAYVEALQKDTGGFALRTIGRSQRGQPIPLLVFTRGGAAAARPTVLIVAQQHGNEPAGSEAALVIATRLARGDLRGLLDRIDVLVVPHANPDGAEAFVRDTAMHVDMNRDHLLLRTPEARAIARIAREYRPDVVVDAHEFTVMDRWVTKFGGVMRYDALIQFATVGNLPRAITDASDRPFRVAVEGALAADGLLPHWYFTTEAGSADRTVSMGGVQPDTWRNIGGLRNAISVLLETRGVGIGRAHFARRVRTHELTMEALLRTAAADPAALLRTTRAAGDAVSAAACHGDYVIAAESARTTETLLFADPASGADRPVEVPWRNALDLHVLRARPRACGYLLDASAIEAARGLRALGVVVERIAARAPMVVERFRVRSSETARRDDGRGAIDDPEGVVRIDVAVERGQADVPAGAFYVSLAQPLGNLAAAALEPDSQSSFAASRRVAMTPEPSVMRVMAVPGAVRYLWDDDADAR